MGEPNPNDKRKVNKRWEKNEIKKLIEAFESKPDLWNPARQNYCNR